MGQCVQKSTGQVFPQINSSPLTKLSASRTNSKLPAFIKQQILYFPPLYNNITEKLAQIEKQQNQLLQQYIIFEQQKCDEETKTLKQRYLEALRKGLFTHNIQIDNKKIYQLHNGSIFQGDFTEQHQIMGLGRLISMENMYVETNFQKGCPSMHTRIIKNNAGCFYGFIQKMDKETQKFSGLAYGTIIQQSIRYTGYIKYQRPHGEGKQRSQQHQFTGTYDYGNKQSGKLIWNIQQKYINYYEGSFKDNKFDGEGQMMENGNHYIGQFKNGKRHGTGVMKFRNGSIYQGQYLIGMRNGLGKLTSNKGDSGFQMIQSGKWQNDIFIGS